jgi:hypothetical protein
MKRVQKFGTGMAEVQKGSIMFKTFFVVWLVLLVLVLSVVSFVTRFVEKHRLVHRFSKSPERTVALEKSSELSILTKQQDQPIHR